MTNLPGGGGVLEVAVATVVPVEMVGVQFGALLLLTEAYPARAARFSRVKSIHQALASSVEQTICHFFFTLPKIPFAFGKFVFNYDYIFS